MTEESQVIFHTMTEDENPREKNREKEQQRAEDTTQGLTLFRSLKEELEKE